MQKSHLIQQLDLSKSNFINANINIQFPHLCHSSHALGATPTYMLSDQQDPYFNHKITLPKYFHPMGDMFMGTMHPKQKTHSSLKKKSSKKIPPNGSIKRQFAQFLKESAKKSMITID